MNLSRFLSAVAFQSLVLVGPVVTTSALAQDAAPPAIEAPSARGAVRGPAARGDHMGPRHGGSSRGGDVRGHHGGRGMHGGMHGGMGPSATPQERLEHRLTRLVGSLGLDATQTAQVRQILTEGQAQHQALAGQRLTGEEAMSRHRGLMEANGQRIRALLRPDQQRIFDAHVSRMREAGDRMEHGRGRLGERARGAMRELLGSLGLDDAQRAAVQQIVTEGRAQHEALRGQALTQEERRARHRAIMEANGQRIRALLRPDQQRTFDARVSELRQRMEARHGAGAPGATPGATSPAGQGI